MPRAPIKDYSSVDRLRLTLQAGTESLRRQEESDFNITQQILQRGIARQQAQFRQAATERFQEEVSPQTLARLKGLTPEEGRGAAVDRYTSSFLAMGDTQNATVAERMHERPTGVSPGVQHQPKLTNERFTIRNPDGTQKDMLRWYSDGQFLREEEVKTGVSPEAAREKRDFGKESASLRAEILKRITELRKENVTLGAEMNRIDGKLFEYKDLNDAERASFKADKERLLADNEDELERLNISIGGSWRKEKKTGAGTTKTGEPKELDVETATKILEEAGGDEEKARKIAKERGYKF